MKLRGTAMTFTDAERARKRQIRDTIELGVAQRMGHNSDRMAGYLIGMMTNVLLELEQCGVDVSEYLDN